MFASSFVIGLAFLFVFLAAPPASAQETPPIDTRFCQQLVKHVPSADTTYQPGVDVHGKPVVPADLAGGSTIRLPDEITIPLTADLMHFLKLKAGSLPASALARSDIQLGTLTLRGDQVFFEGQPLTNAQQDNLAVLCLKPTPNLPGKP